MADFTISYVIVTVMLFDPSARGETLRSSIRLATRREMVPAELKIGAKVQSSGDSMQPVKNAESVMSVSRAKEYDLPGIRALHGEVLPADITYGLVQYSVGLTTPSRRSLLMRSGNMAATVAPSAVPYEKPGKCQYQICPIVRCRHGPAFTHHSISAIHLLLGHPRSAFYITMKLVLARDLHGEG